MISKALLSFFLIILVATSASSLNWSEAVSLTEQKNHELASAKKDLESSDWTYKKSFSAFLPQVSGNASVSDSGASSQSYAYGLSATQYLFKGMSGIYGIQSAYSSLEYQKASLALTRAAVLYDLRSSFLDVLVAQENVKLLEQILKQRKENTELIQLRYDSGKEDKGNLMGTHADQAQAKYDLTSAKRDLKLAKLKLSQILQYDVTEVEANKDPLDLGQVDLDLLIRDNPTYIMSKRNLESAELAQKAVLAEFLPSVSLSGSYRKTGSDWPPETSSKSWSLNLSLPIFPGGSNVADWVIYSAKLDKAKADHAAAIDDLKYALAESYENFQDAVEALAVTRISLAADKERAMISRAKYLNGLTTYDEWDRIENSYIQAQKGLLSYEKNALLAEALWHKTIGGYVK